LGIFGEHIKNLKMMYKYLLETLSDQSPEELVVFLINTGDGRMVNLLENQNFEFFPAAP